MESREYFTDKRLFTLNEILVDHILYPHFLSYLQVQLSAENLLCIRMIHIFEELIVSPEQVIYATDHAWIIYRYILFLLLYYS